MAWAIYKNKYVSCYDVFFQKKMLNYYTDDVIISMAFPHIKIYFDHSLLAFINL